MLVQGTVSKLTYRWSGSDPASFELTIAGSANLTDLKRLQEAFEAKTFCACKTMSTDSLGLVVETSEAKPNV